MIGFIMPLRMRLSEVVLGVGAHVIGFIMPLRITLSEVVQLV